MFQRLRSCWQMCVSCDCASGCVLVSTHTYLSTRCRHEWRWREVGLFDRGSPTLEEKRREGAQRGQQKKCFKAHWPRLWSPPPLRAPLSPCEVAMWEKKWFSQRRPPPPALCRLLSCSNPERPTAWLSPPTPPPPNLPLPCLPPPPPPPCLCCAVLWWQGRMI